VTENESEGVKDTREGICVTELVWDSVVVALGVTVPVEVAEMVEDAETEEVADTVEVVVAQEEGDRVVVAVSEDEGEPEVVTVT
jgi:hypothetical protein